MCVCNPLFLAPVRATVGEISDALRAVWGDHVPKSSVVHNAYSSQYSESSDSSFDDVR